MDCAVERAEIFTSAALHAVRSRLMGAPSTGVCRSCSHPIEPIRLRVTPQTRLCGDCAQEDEIRRLRERRCGPR